MHKFQQAGYDKLVTMWKNAVGQFVIAAANNLVVDTGMTLGSLIPVGRAVRVITESNLNRAYSGKAKFGLTEIQGNYQPGLVKNVEAGIQLGEKGIGYDIKYGSRKRIVFQFWFNILVFQWFLREERIYQGHGPYLAIQAGKRAMDAYFFDAQRRFFTTDIWMTREIYEVVLP